MCWISSLLKERIQTIQFCKSDILFKKYAVLMHGGVCIACFIIYARELCKITSSRSSMLAPNIQTSIFFLTKRLNCMNIKILSSNKTPNMGKLAATHICISSNFGEVYIFIGPFKPV